MLDRILRLQWLITAVMFDETITKSGSKLTNIGDSVAPFMKKQKLTAFSKLLCPQKLAQESITLENELEKYLALLEKETVLHKGKLILLGLIFCHLLQHGYYVCLLHQYHQKGFSQLQD